MFVKSQNPALVNHNNKLKQRNEEINNLLKDQVESSMEFKQATLVRICYFCSFINVVRDKIKVELEKNQEC